jgi:UDP-N-acetylglucosamine 4,6-dehydratase
MFSSKIILVTGGTGSFGNQCVRHLLKKSKAKKIIIFSRDELKQYEMLNQLTYEGYDKTRLRFLLGDVRDKSRLSLSFREVDTVIHTAALKQIPAAEYNPQECINTNINGANNIILSAIEQGVKKVIALSTDKACSPINLYGATKLAADKLFVSGNYLGGKNGTIFSIVRYGNVLNSRGSIIPLYNKLISENQKTLPLTDENMSRFFIGLEEGVEFVLNCFERMQGGEIFIPKLPTIYIKDIIKAFNKNYRIIGIRPGEKLHEVLCSREESHMVYEFKKHYVIKPTLWEGSVKNYKIDKKNEVGKKVNSSFEYNSQNNKFILNVNQIKNLLSKF